MTNRRREASTSTKMAPRLGTAGNERENRGEHSVTLVLGLRQRQVFRYPI